MVSKSVLKILRNYPLVSEIFATKLLCHLLSYFIIITYNYRLKNVFLLLSVESLYMITEINQFIDNLSLKLKNLTFAVFVYDVTK